MDINKENIIKEQIISSLEPIYIRTPLYELTLMPIKNIEEDKMDDNIHLSMLGNFDIIEKSNDTDGENDRVIAGYASVIDVDSDNHIIPKDTLSAGIQTLLKDSDYSNLMIVHKNIQIGKILKEYKGLVTHVNDKGLYIVAKIRKDLKTADKVWSYILSGELNAFSIAGEVILSHKQCDDKSCVRVIDKLNIYEVSVCQSPKNEKSGFIVVSKADADLSIKDDVIENISNGGPDIMAKKEPCQSCQEVETKADSEQKVEEPKVEKEVKSEEPIKKEEVKANIDLSSIERRLEALEASIQGLMNPKEPEGEEVPEEEEPEDEEMASKEKPKEEVKPKETPIEEPIKESYPTQKAFDELKLSIDNLVKGMKAKEDLQALETLVKSKDDSISMLSKRIEVLEKIDVTPKTTTEVVKEPVVEKESAPILSKDSLGNGVWFKNPDY